MKKFLRRIIGIAGAALMSGFCLQAQDIHFSQYNGSPLLLNPSLAGMNAGDYRAYANFRTQWVTLSKSNTYRTFSGGADMSIGRITKSNSFAGIGISFFSDQAGDLNLNSNHLDLSFAYHFMLNRRGTQQLSAGIQGGINFRSINASKAIFDSQYDPVTGTTIPNSSGETFGKTKTIFADAGLGLTYSAMTRHGANFYLGFAINHLNQPKISFGVNGKDGKNSIAEKLPMKYTIHGGASIPLGNGRIAVMPNFMVLVQGTSHEFNVGLYFKGVLGNIKLSKTALYLGAQYRGVYDAVIAGARLDVKGFSLGMSYDINISKLLQASKTIGAPELSLMYQGAFRKKPHPGHCPAMF